MELAYRQAGESTNNYEFVTSVKFIRTVRVLKIEN